MDRVLADDLSGACECAGLAALRGLRATVYLQSPCESLDNAVDVHVFDLDCRERGGEEAARAAREWFRSGTGLLPVSEGSAAACFRNGNHGQDAYATGRATYLKIDSAFRGPIGAMVRAAADCLAQERVLVCCAVPYTERWTVGGIHTIRGVPLDQTPFADDPRWPIRSAHLPTLLQDQLGEAVASLRPEQIADEWPAGVRWAIADAQSIADLRRMARAWSNRLLSVGAGGFWQAILDETSGGSFQRPARSEGLRWRRPLVVNGSTDPIARGQIRHLRAVEPDVACVTVPEGRISPDEAMRRIVGETMASLEKAECDGLVLSGGHTARAVLDALGVNVLEVLRQGPEGFTEARAALPDRRLLNVLIKPGSYGPADVYETLIRSASS